MMISPAASKAHVALMKQRFRDAIPDPLPAILPAYSRDLLRYFRDQLDLILGGRPEDLIQVVLHVKGNFGEFDKQARRSRSGKAWKRFPSDAAIVNLVGDCFDYQAFSTKSKSWCAYSLVEALDGRICPYCQLHHINYHVPAGRREFSLRPPLDHFLPRSRYPYLAVSLGNLVPCCSQCNSSVKIAMDPLDTGVLHPSSRALVDRVGFSAKGSIPTKLGGRPSDVKVTVSSTDAALRSHIAAFRLNERYAWYAREIHDLMRNFDRYHEYPTPVQQVVDKDDFVLGFPADEAKDRALGHCLLDVFCELKSGAIA